MLCLQIAGYHLLADSGKRFHPEALGSGEWLIKHPIKQYGGGHFHYAVYYVAQAMWQLGDKYWEQFAEAMFKHMLKTQQADGSWRGHSGGPAYATAMTVLAMTVTYRQLPIYQR